ncbi:heme biosynthesis protein HemY [Pseudorhodoplanes sp.]|jgi:HemY protein|uniref:heme biosynthesis protein HemY n=1 Tax=Pseudorhodoplanes sp. TaxID=1934341 RepID=UPI002C633E49|nr:heme biosynthesis HemY N-terminal domain-containing protein [Pseudorhodoplanes sp.]HWV42951.1 heme biosynthesis HemY N-terminal domain-containing protein [Pseudorhodoplanes sp.]
MIRVASFFIIVGLIALGVTWLADRPGDVHLTWLGWHIETSLMVLLAVALALLVAGIFAWSILRGLWRSPARVATAMRDRKDARGQRAIMRGLIAIGAGDTRAAQRYADEVKRIAADDPLALLLTAQAAQLSGDRSAAEKAFRRMTASEDTKLLGLRGLFIEAQRRGDLASAIAYAEEAATIAPSSPWAGQAVLQIRCANGDWAGALDMLEKNRAAGALDRHTHRRHRAVLLTARALALEETERDTSQALVQEAVKLAPTLVPAVALAARYHAEGGDLRKASRLIERAFEESPHPDLAETYAYLRFGDSARDRLSRVRKLAALAPDHLESALALARAAIDAREFAEARKALAPFVAKPTQRVALLMADLEQAEFADEGRSREWTARAVHAARDPAWVADGFVSDRWLPICPVSGRIDAFEWKAPPAAIGQASEPVDEAVALEPSRPTIEAKPAAPVAPPPAPASPPKAPPAVKKGPRAVPESVVPITHVPDDPGPPEPDQDREPQSEPSSASPGWKRLFFF